MTRGEQFRSGTELLRGSLSFENRKLLYNYGFTLLGQIDDGKTGKGYGLALHLGRFVGIKSIHDVQATFQADQRLPEYQGEHGFKDSFFQDTVNNARNWWAENQKDFVQ
jgi:hypothetical protein